MSRPRTCRRFATTNPTALSLDSARLIVGWLTPIEAANPACVLASDAVRSSSSTGNSSRRSRVAMAARTSSWRPKETIR